MALHHKITIILFNLCLGCIISQAQEPPGLVWKKNFGEKKKEQGHDLTVTADGRIALIGSTNSTPSKSEDALFMLLGENGAVIKQQVLGTDQDDALHHVNNTFDGGFLLSGHTRNPQNRSRDGWLVKLDERGDTLWQKVLGGGGEDGFAEAVQTRDGGLIAAGYFGVPGGKRAMWIYRAYEDGSLRWQKTFGHKSRDEATAILETKDGRFAVVGTTTSGKGNQNIWLFILDSEGQPMKYQLFGSRQFEGVYDLIELQDGGFALTGYAKTNKKNKGKGLRDMWVIRTNAEGELMWQRTFGGTSNDSAYGITETTDGGLVLVGYTFSHLMGANTSSALVIKCDQEGNIVWEMPAIGGKNNDRLQAVAQTPEGSLVALGTTASKSEGAQKEDIWVMKFAPEGQANTIVPTNLVIKSVILREDGNKILEEEETGFFEVLIENTGSMDAFDVNLILNDPSQTEGLAFPAYQRLGFLKSGGRQLVMVPITANEKVGIGEPKFEFFCTDASRTRTKPFELTIATKPLEIPSDYLQIVWSEPSPVAYEQLFKKVKTSRMPIRLKARSDQPLKRRFFTLYLNGEPYKVGQKAGETKLLKKGQNGEIYDFDFQNFVDLKVGMNNLQMVVDNGSVQDTSEIFQIEYSNRPNLHLLAVGIEHDDLLYTTKDARDFAKVFANQKDGLFDQVFITSLTSGTKTAAGTFQTEGEVIKEAFANLENSYEYTIYEQDLLVVFLSSHGKTINNKFKVVPTDFSMMGESVLIDYEKDIIQPLENLPCHKLLFIDACHSGSYASEGLVGAGNSTADPYAQAIVQLSETLQTTNTIASCQADESSWEDKIWENGAFTEALIGAFQNESYTDDQGQFQVTTDNSIITVAELYQYLLRRVPQMIKDAGKQGSQHPFLSAEQLDRASDLPLFEVK